MKHDVIVIGSGFGGLLCAAVIARTGRRVLVLERQSQPGGCIQSYRRHGLAFDTGLHYVGGLDQGQRLGRIFARLGLMDLPWQRLDPEGFDRVTIGSETFSFAQGYDAFVDTLARRFPSERAALQRYTQVLQQVEAVPFGSAEAYTLFGTNAYSYLSTLFTDPLLVNVLAGSALKMELQRESLPLFTFAHGQSSFIQGSWRLRGEGNLLVSALTADIECHGGQIVCHRQVSELTEHDGRITAVRCTDGSVYEGDTVISDIHPALTFNLVRESALLRKLFRRRISSLDNTHGMFTASLVLKPGALPYFNHNKFVYREANVWAPPSAFAATQPADATVDRVMVSCRMPATAASGIAEPLQVDLLTPMSWQQCAPWADTTVGRRGDDYQAMKRRLAQQCLSLAETVVPGLGAMVSECHTSTPLTWRDYTLTPYGSAYGIRKDSRNLTVTMLSPRTPIPNLLLTGQNLMLHGLEGVTMTALLTCSNIVGREQVSRLME